MTNWNDHPGPPGDTRRGKEIKINCLICKRMHIFVLLVNHPPLLPLPRPGTSPMRKISALGFRGPSAWQDGGIHEIDKVVREDRGWAYT